MTERPLVLFLGHGAERSGPPIYLLRLLRWWNHHPPPFDVEVVLARPGPLLDEYRACSATRVGRLDRRSPERLAERALDVSGQSRWGAIVIDAATRRRVGSDRTPQLTVLNGATAPTAQLLRALGSPGRVGLIAHELSTGWLHNIDSVARQLLLRADRFLAVSQCVQRFLVSEMGVPADRITIAPPAVDSTEVGGIRQSVRQHGQAVIGGGGMTDWRKAPELWLRVAHEARRAAPSLPMRFIWVGGDAPESPAFWPLAHEIRHLGLDGAVEFMGDVTRPGAVIGSCDLFVSTAREDAYPLLCAESAMSGVPVLAFDDGGAAELIADADCGVAVAYPDVHQMAQHVVELVRSPDRRAELGRRGRRFALDQLDVSVVAPQVEAWLCREMAS